MIPKIIHYCWFGKKPESQPKIIGTCFDSWKKHNPDYEIKMWNEETFDINTNNWTKETYNSGISAYGYLADYVRLSVLYNYGGIFVDADYQMLGSLDNLLDNKLFVGQQDINEYGTAIIGCEPKNPVIKQLLDYYEPVNYILFDNNLNRENLPRMLYKRLTNLPEDLCDGVTVYAKEYFYPDGEPEETSYGKHLCLNSRNRTVSILMPVYNGEQYITECIDSVMNQTFEDFEFIIVDDGSEDKTEEIIKSYNDDRIVYIKKEHSGIVETLNLGLKRCVGKYVARMDSDDIMYSDRLSHQVEIMENNPVVDILGGSFEYDDKEKNRQQWIGQGRVTLEMFSHGNYMAHPTVMMRKSSIEKLPFVYEKIYEGAEDQKLWCTASSHGLTIANDSKVVIYYRIHEGQKYHQQASARATYMIQNAYSNKNTDTATLTVIIPFQNEGCEIEKTVTSIRSTSGNVNIMLIDDFSDDGYDYKKVADLFGCEFYRTEKNLGVAGARDFGVSKCKTPYFLLLDGHMRFYDFNWETKITDMLDEKKERIVTCQTVYITKRNGEYFNENGAVRYPIKGGSYCACLSMLTPGREFTSKWTSYLINKDLNEETTPVSCVLGAVYASSVQWWNHIGGLKGLIKYGLDEPLMSMKTWLAGGDIVMYKYWAVGHLYREKGNYDVTPAHVDHNQLVLIHLFAPEAKIPEYVENLKRRVGEESFNVSYKMFTEHKDEIDEMRRDFWERIAIHDLDYFYEINDKVMS